MGINKNSDGTWVAHYSKRNPKTGMPVSLRRIKLVSRAEAIRVERHLIFQVSEKINDKITPTWEALVNEYLQSCITRGLTKKSIYNADKCLKAATFKQWRARLCNTITTVEIRALVVDEMSGYSQTHQKGILKYIRGAFEHGVEAGHLTRNPTPQLKFRIGDKIKKVLTEEQVRTLLNKALEYEWEWYPHCATALYSGMRNGELYALTWDKVNLDQCKILVDSSWNNKDGFKSTKSGDDRIVEMAPNLVPIFKQLKLQSGGSDFVLPRISRWDKGEHARELRMFLVGIGLPPVRFHDLRATWATLMLSNGVEPVKVMVMGGWKDMKTMMIYIRKAGVDIRGCTAKLDLHDPVARAAKVLEFGRSPTS